jgi:hypothetical protein
MHRVAVPPTAGLIPADHAVDPHAMFRCSGAASGGLTDTAAMVCRRGQSPVVNPEPVKPYGFARIANASVAQRPGPGRDLAVVRTGLVVNPVPEEVDLPAC